MLETSIDETLPYEPNRTVEDSDEEENKNKPCLDEQIKMLEEELINPTVQKELNLSPQLIPTVVQEAPKKSKQSSTVCLKVTVLSLVFTLLLFLALFYVVFFSPLKHPLIAKLRANLVFLEPVKDVLVHKTNQLVSYFKK